MKPYISCIQPRISSLLLTLIFLVGTTFSEVYSQDNKKADQETIDIINSADNEKGKKTGALIIYKEYENTIDDTGDNTLVLRIIGKVYNNQALEAYSHIPIPYNSYYEEASLDFARVIKNDGTTIEVRQDAIQIKTSPDFMGDTKYSDTRYLTFALSGLEIGAAFEYKAVIKQKRAVIEGEWFDNHYFGSMLQNLAPPYIPRTDPVTRSVYRLRVPKNSEFIHHISKNPKDPVKKTINKQDEYTWEYSGLDAVDFEASMPPLGTLNPVLLIGTINNWSKIDQWAAIKLNSGSEITPVFRDLVKKILKETFTREDRIKAITEYIQKNIRYVYADLGRGGYTPHPLMETINSNYGDCKDQGMLLVAMLRESGIEAYPALINPSPSDEFTEIPSPFFSHVITCIPGEKDTLWFDMTNRILAYPELPAADQHRTAFIVNGKGGFLTKTPRSSFDLNTASFDVRCEFNQGTAGINMSIKAFGFTNEILKAAFMTAEDNELKEYLRNYIRNYVAKPQFDTINISDLNDSRIPFNVQIRYHLDSMWQKSQAMFSFSGHSVMALAFFGFDSRSMAEGRQNDLISELPFTIRSSEVYNPPESCPLTITIPEDESMKNDFFEFSKKFSANGKSTIVNWELRTKKMVIPKEKYGAYAGEIKKMQEMATWNITYVDPVAFSRSMEGEDPRSILKECNELLRENKNNVFALLMKGLSFNRLNMRDSSIAVFSKVLRIDPQNKYAHLWIVLPLSASKKNQEVLTHLDKALFIDPGFAEAYIAKGAMYITQLQKEKALGEFRKAVEADPLNAFAWYTLGIYYYEEKQYKESIESIKNVIKLDSASMGAYNMLARNYMKTEAYSEAIDIYKKALDQDPGNGMLYGNLGWTYYLKDDFVKCIEFSEKALSIDTELYYVRFNIAIANLRMGNIEEANKLYGKLRNEKYLIPRTQIEGAIEDLRELKKRGILVKESDKIIKSF